MDHFSQWEQSMWCDSPERDARPSSRRRWREEALWLFAFVPERSALQGRMTVRRGTGIVLTVAAALSATAAAVGAVTFAFVLFLVALAAGTAFLRAFLERREMLALLYVASEVSSSLSAVARTVEQYANEPDECMFRLRSLALSRR